MTNKFSIPARAVLVFLTFLHTVNLYIAINIENSTGGFSVSWFDPRNGGELQSGSVTEIKGGQTHELNGAPSESDKDWVVLLQKK